MVVKCNRSVQLVHLIQLQNESLSPFMQEERRDLQ